jgi:hypothetical protein
MTDKLVNVNSRASLTEFASELKGFIVKQKLFSDIKGKNYVNVEGWEFAGMATGISPIVKIVEKLLTNTEGEIAYRAEVELVSKSKVVGYGVAICSNKEYSKKSFEEYAIASMAQTRAIGKAYRNKFAFLMKMAGYESTPTEEIVVVEAKEASEETINDITEGYKKMIAEATTEPKKRIVLRKMKGGLDNGVIDQKTFGELKKLNGLEENV